MGVLFVDSEKFPKKAATQTLFVLVCSDLAQFDIRRKKSELHRSSTQQLSTPTYEA